MSEIREFFKESAKVAAKSFVCGALVTAAVDIGLIAFFMPGIVLPLLGLSLMAGCLPLLKHIATSTVRAEDRTGASFVIEMFGGVVGGFALVCKLFSPINDQIAEKIHCLTDQKTTISVPAPQQKARAYNQRTTYVLQQSALKLG